MAEGNDTGRPQFARSSTAGQGSTVELRGECPREIVDVLDAISMARDMTRTALVNEILGAWKADVIHEHTVLHSVVGFTPTRSGPSGGLTE